MIALHTCPVQDVQAQAELLDLFDASYRVEVLGMGGAAQYRRQALPVDAGMLEQPARVLDGLHLIEWMANDELAADLAAGRRTRQTKDRDDG